VDATYTCPSCGGASDLKAERCPYCGSPFLNNLGPAIGSARGATVARQQAAVLEAKTAKDPKNGAAFLELGEVYHELGQYPKADEALKKAAQLLPQEAEVFLMLAWNTAIGRGWEKAEVADNAARALAIDPKLGRAEALMHLNQGMSDFLFDRSILHLKMALEEFQKAVALDPKNTYGYFMTGCVLEEMYELPLAAENFAKAAGLAADDAAPGREDARIYARAGYTYFKLKDFAKAKPFLENAVKLDPDNDAARSLLATIAQG